MSGSGYSASAFKRSIGLYTGGRLLNALLAFFIFAWLARHLPEQQYANYIAAFACLELGLILLGFGMDWVTAVQIPRFRLHAPERLARFAWQCAGLQGGLLAVGAIAFHFSAEQIAGWLNLYGAGEVLRLYALVMLAEGISRVFRDQLLACLLLQGASQASQLLRNVFMAGFALLLGSQPDWRTANALALAELIASTLSLTFGALALHRHLRTMPTAVTSNTAGWIAPRWPQLFHAGRNAWLSSIANLCWGGQAVILIATRLIGADATAVLGFTRNLADQIRRYLPMEFLLGVVRTYLISRLAKDGDRHQLGLRAGLMYRVNLLFVLPLLALAITHGDQLCAALSNGRYTAGHWLLVGWLCVLVPWAHHRISDLLANAVGRSDLTSRSSLVLLPVPLLVALAAFSQNWAAVFGVLAAAELCYSALVLRHIDFYAINWPAIAKLVLAALLAGTVLAAPAFAGDSLPALAGKVAVAFLIVFAGAMFARAWSREEQALIGPTPRSAGAA